MCVQRAQWVRKAIHVPAGLAPAAFVWSFGWVGSCAIALFVLAYVVVGLDAHRRGLRLPIIGGGIDLTWSGGEGGPRGGLQFLGGILVLGLLFPLPYFLPAIALLGAGDGAAALAGTAWGRHRLPWNRKKSWEGLAAGILVGTPVAILFAVLGSRLDPQSHALPVASPSVVVGFILAAYAAATLSLRVLVRAGLAPRSSNAPPAQVLAALAVSLAPAVAFLLTVPAWLEGPLLPLAGGHGRLGFLLPWIPILVMFVESAINRNDNLWVPGLYAALSYVVAFLGNRL